MATGARYTYTRKDLVAALNKVEPYDWEKFFKERVDAVAPKAPLAGLERGGYRLVYADTPNDVWREGEMRSRAANLLYSIGLRSTRPARSRRCSGTARPSRRG